jgi:hypothetical protein
MIAATSGEQTLEWVALAQLETGRLLSVVG